MPEPNFRDHRVYLGPLLRVLRGKGPSEPEAVYEEVADLVGVTPEQRGVRGERETDNPVYRNRIQFARQSLIDAGAVIGSDSPQWKRGLWQLTPAGIALADSTKSDQKLDGVLRERAAKGARKRAEARKASRELAGLDVGAASSTAPDDGVTTAEEERDDNTPVRVLELVDSANQNVFGRMLDQVRSMNDTAFEFLVGEVLKAALRAESVEVTQRSRDGGIDGVLNFDALGMRVAVFQAKRFAEKNTVGRKDIDAFATVARRRCATHSLFVSSSRFSDEAVKAAKSEGIRLIDGDAFVELMATHGIGFRAVETWVLYEADPAWSLDPA